MVGHLPLDIQPARMNRFGRTTPHGPRSSFHHVGAEQYYESAVADILLVLIWQELAPRKSSQLELFVGAIVFET